MLSNLVDQKSKVIQDHDEIAKEPKLKQKIYFLNLTRFHLPTQASVLDQIKVISGDINGMRWKLKLKKNPLGLTGSTYSLAY